MMRRWALVLAISFAVSCVSPSAPPDAPSAQAVYDRYLEARGGQAALDSMRVVERIGWISVDTGANGLLAGSYHTCLRFPDRVAIEIDAGPWQVAQALRADGAFECDAGFTACRPASGAVTQDLTETAAHANKDLLERASAWAAGAVTATNDGRAWRVSIAEERWAEFDRGDGRLRALGVGERWRRLGQWRAVEGVTFPHRLEDFMRQSDGDSDWRNTVQLREVRVAETPSPWCVERFGDA